MMNYGDKVILNGEEGKVISIWNDALNRRMVKVEFDDRSLPYYVDYEQNVENLNTYNKPIKRSLDGDWGSSNRRFYARDTEKYCPVCDTPWTVTKFEKKVWYDCSKCKKTKEQLV